MPKLIIKQDVDPARLQAQRNKRLSIIGLLILLAVVTVAAFLLTRPAINSLAQEPLKLDSATSIEAKNSYISLHNIFNKLSTEYETLAAQGSDDYEKNLRLLDQSGAILRHLEKMQQIVPEIGLGDNEQKQLYNRQQFYKDYWQAKSHFRRLRVSHFENGTNGGGTVLPEWREQAEAAIIDDRVETETMSAAADAPISDTDNPPRKFKFATPPAGMELPADFCDLTNPGSCKPGTAEVGMSTGQNNQAN